MEDASDPDPPPVLIVGAGPTGLTLACELLRRGIGVRLVDRNGGPTPRNQSRALGIQARTLEFLDLMGVVAPVVSHGKRIRRVNFHENGRITAHVELDFGNLNTPYPFLLSLSQGDTERFLLERLRDLGGTVEWNTELRDLHRNQGGIGAELDGPEGATKHVEADWLIGCDGASSTVRHQLNLDFTGTAYPQNFHLADLHLNWDLKPDEAQLMITDYGFVPAIPLPEDGLWRLIDATEPPELKRDRAILDRFRMLLEKAGREQDPVVETEWISSFRIHRRMVENFRVGRVFLAGDAAHVHSPVGGQGMNTGIQDAVNLGWKLALVVNGRAEEGLLDTYDAERRPVARRVLRATDWATRVVTLENSFARFVRNTIMGWSTRSNYLVRRATRVLSELGLGYRNGPVGTDEWTSNRGLHPGDRVPDAQLRSRSDGDIRLFDLLRGGRFVLLWFEGSPDRPTVDLEVDGMALEEFDTYRVSTEQSGDESENELIDPDGQLHDRFDARRGGLYVLRPDGHVGYRSDAPTLSGVSQWLRSIGVTA